MRLFCLPPAGGSPSIFHRWSSLLGDDIEVLAAQLPGRGFRLRETPCRRMAQWIHPLLDAIRSRLDAPYAIFGHSLGAAVGFELVQALRREGARLAVSLFVSARPAPQRPRAHRPIHPLPQAEFLRALEERYGLADATLRDPQMAAMLFPPLQADMEIYETWEPRAEAPLPVPIIAFAGSHDPVVTREAIDAWREQTSKRFAMHVMDGDHFYLQSDPRPLLALLHDALAHC